MKQPACSRSRHRGTLAGAIGLSVVILLGMAIDASAQCSLCRDAVSASPLETREAMNYAILALAFAPYGVAALAVWILFPRVRARVKAGFRRLAPRRQEKLS